MRFFFQKRLSLSIFRFKRFSSLSNPMFPERARPEIPESVMDPADSFLTKHGGKVALAGFSLAGAIAYRWYMGGRTRTILEEEISNESPVDPYECNELRRKNNMSMEQFQPFVDYAFSQPNASNLSYIEFMTIYNDYFNAHSNMKYDIQDSHLMERLILHQLQQQTTLNTTTNHNANNKNNSQIIENINKLDIYSDVKLPLTFYIVVLSMILSITTTTTPVIDDKSNNNKYKIVCDALFHIAQKYNNINDENYITVEQLEVIIHNLLLSYQIPSEKRVMENGVYYPYKCHRRKESKDMVTEALTKIPKDTGHEGYIDKSEFENILIGTVVCAWGECYRKK